MNYSDFYKLLAQARLIGPVWEYLLDMMAAELIVGGKNTDVLKLFAIYFGLVDDGNACMSLDAEKLKAKWLLKVDEKEVLLSEKEDVDKAIFGQIRAESASAIESLISCISEPDLPEIIGKNKMFNVEDGWLYAKKYFLAGKGLTDSCTRLFGKTFSGTTGDYKKWVVPGFKLSSGQAEAVEKGVNNNLIITGGPGTGKTTSILFLLLNLLKADKDREIFLVAPSGKASSRMKESIISGLVNLDPAFAAANSDLIEIIKNLEESTIHRLLGQNFKTGGFDYGKSHQFSAHSIFIVDEASMIDVCLFNVLLAAIPDGARLFVMGDKNQLPSVEVGAVLSDLLKSPKLSANIVELDQSIRFSKDTDIYKLAEAVNAGAQLPVKDSDWKPYSDFNIEADNPVKPVYFYQDSAENVRERDLVEFIAHKWGNKYFKDLQAAASDMDPANASAMETLFEMTELSRILTAENDGPRGVNSINSYIKKQFIDQSASVNASGLYPGMLMMITKNNKMLDIYNGDNGILVTFKGDSTLYLMVKKSSKLVDKEGKVDDKIWKTGSFMFYPVRMITRSEIDMAYAITIHKSQGSDYKNILVILPKKMGHPLLNRQIIYTAITRTKGNTYILSNMDRLNEAKDRLLERDTNIVL